LAAELALSYGAPIYGFGVLSYDYELNSHTAGAALDFETRSTQRT